METGLGDEVAFVYHNSINSITTITVCLHEPGNIAVEIYNILGEKIATLLNREMAAGLNFVSWNDTGARGTVVSGGYYFFRI